MCYWSMVQDVRGGGFRVFAIIGESGGGFLEKKHDWSTIFEVEDPRASRVVHQNKGKVFEANEALEVARFDIQYCDWRARQDLLTIVLLHDKVCLER